MEVTISEGVMEITAPKPDIPRVQEPVYVPIQFREGRISDVVPHLAPGTMTHRLFDSLARK
jgi:hypothetical protein